MKNSEFAEKDEVFLKACEKADVKPTKRQASRFRNKKGMAYRFKRKAVIAVNKARKETNQ